MEKSKKRERYKRLLIQIEELLKKSDDETAHMATIAAVLYHKLDYFYWCGFYRIVNGELIVGPYQGTVACQKLEKNIGVCWAGINEEATIIVPDVNKFPGHIACDVHSKSEIVIPFKDENGIVKGVLDVDSKDFDSFDEVDAQYLEKIIAIL